MGARKTRFRALVRTASARERLDGSGAWMVDGDLMRPQSLEAALTGVRTVIHLAALVGSSDPAKNKAVNERGTEHLLAACRSVGVQRVVFLSSDSTLREQRSPYAESKRAAERAVLRWGEEEDQRAIVLRPPVVLGSESPHLAQFVRLSRLPLVPLPRDTASRFPVGLEDLCDALLAAVELPKEAVPGCAIDLPGATEVDFDELVTMVAKARGVRPPTFRRLPTRALRLSVGVLGPRAGEILEGIGQQVDLDARLAQELFGWNPKPLSDVLAAALAPGH